MAVDRSLAQLYASWFKCLGDATRIQILSLLASRRGTMSVREIVDALGVGQPTISHHLRQLERARFVICERHGASTLVRVNRRRGSHGRACGRGRSDPRSTGADATLLSSVDRSRFCGTRAARRVSVTRPSSVEDVRLRLPIDLALITETELFHHSS